MMYYAAYVIEKQVKRRITPLILVCFSCVFLLTASDINSVFPDERPETIRGPELASDSFVFMFYNVENLFDAVDDSLKDDEEYLPGGARGWTNSRYYQKLNSIAKVILSAGSWEPPALVGLCETENRAVAEALVRLTPLNNYRYGVVYTESDDARGIDIGLLYDRDKFDIVSFRAISPDMGKDQSPFTSRPVLYVKLKKGEEYLHLLLNHWPSRRGGVLAGQDLRHRLAETVRSVVDSLFLTDGIGSAVIVAGDFNCDPSGSEIKLLSGEGMVNLSIPGFRQGIGTYRYRGVWQMIDQIIVSESMINGDSYFSAKDFTVHSPDFLLIDDPVYPGRKPFSTYDTYRYAGGYSDHLPVVITLDRR
jgi:hypothetical protein